MKVYIHPTTGRLHQNPDCLGRRPAHLPTSGRVRLREDDLDDEAIAQHEHCGRCWPQKRANVTGACQTGNHGTCGGTLSISVTKGCQCECHGGTD